VVERLVANEKVASSTLVTRSFFRLRCIEASGTAWQYLETIHLWRKLAEPRWLSAHESILQARSRGRLVIISRPGRKRLQLEIAYSSLNESRKLVGEFGGRTEKWPRHWLKRFADLHKSKPLKIGTRLLISSVRGTSASRVSGHKGRSHILIPASAAFGTGEHATTAMSLRFLERLTRKWKYGWSLADLGTGSGILALAAKRLGAGSVIGIDNDPKAISIAKANARLNKIGRVNFRLGDVRKWNPTDTRDVVAGNLYNELLIEVLPKLKQCTWLILSGVLRTQENEFVRVLRRKNIKIVNVKRRGKWIAVMANCRDR
jgi:ribosomal protein L11 methyltransferase